MQIVEKIKEALKKFMGFLGVVTVKIEHVQEHIDDAIDKVEEEVEEAKSMLDKASSDEEK